MEINAFVINAKFYYSTKRHDFTENHFEPGNEFQEIETILDAQRLLATKVGEIRMIATLFNPDEACQVSSEEGDLISFRRELVYSSDIKSLENSGHILSVTTWNNTIYCVLRGNTKM